MINIVVELTAKNQHQILRIKRQDRQIVHLCSWHTHPPLNGASTEWRTSFALVFLKKPVNLKEWIFNQSLTFRCKSDIYPGGEEQQS